MASTTITGIAYSLYQINKRMDLHMAWQRLKLRSKGQKTD
jgi:hypothetical protein